MLRRLERCTSEEPHRPQRILRAAAAGVALETSSILVTG